MLNGDISSHNSSSGMDYRKCGFFHVSSNRLHGDNCSHTSSSRMFFPTVDSFMSFRFFTSRAGQVLLRHLLLQATFTNFYFLFIPTWGFILVVMLHFQGGHNSSLRYTLEDVVPFFYIFFDLYAHRSTRLLEPDFFLSLLTIACHNRSSWIVAHHDMKLNSLELLCWTFMGSLVMNFLLQA